jgi:hypothetical protein
MCTTESAFLVKKFQVSSFKFWNWKWFPDNMKPETRNQQLHSKRTTLHGRHNGLRQ